MVRVVDGPAPPGLCGGHGVKVTDRRKFENAIRESLDHKRPALIEIMTDADLA